MEERLIIIAKDRNMLRITGDRNIMKQYCYYQSPIGRLLLIGEEGILEELHFPNSAEDAVIGDNWLDNEEHFSDVLKQLGEYFAGSRQSFEVKMDPKGTDFQRRVWQELQRIPFGKTASYGEIAQRINNPKACRAVGGANGKNPIPIIIPCHRIIGNDGSLTGFGGGLELKKTLLRLENIPLK